MNIVCALRWGVASVGIFSLLGVAHPIWEKHFRCWIYADGQLASRVARVNKAGLWPCNIFVTVLDKKFL